MKSFRIHAALLACVFATLLPSSLAHAQLDEDLAPPARKFESPERLAIELRLGPYQPQDNATFDQYFRGDDGLMLGLELDVIAYRIPNILYLSGGGSIGWANYTGQTIDETTGERAAEETELELIPLSLLGVARFDALARKFGIPFILTGKLGYSWVHWSTSAGGADTASGWSLGLAYAGQLALDLDSFEPAAARVMDEEWGINHSFLFFELYGFSPTSESHPVGDLTWTVGLGFVF